MNGDNPAITTYRLMKTGIQGPATDESCSGSSIRTENFCMKKEGIRKQPAATWERGSRQSGEDSERITTIRTNSSARR